MGIELGIWKIDFKVWNVKWFLKGRSFLKMKEKCFWGVVRMFFFYCGFFGIFIG